MFPHRAMFNSPSSFRPLPPPKHVLAAGDHAVVDYVLENGLIYVSREGERQEMFQLPAREVQRNGIPYHPEAAWLRFELMNNAIEHSKDMDRIRR